MPFLSLSPARVEREPVGSGLTEPHDHMPGSCSLGVRGTLGKRLVTGRGGFTSCTDSQRRRARDKHIGVSTNALHSALRLIFSKCITSGPVRTGANRAALPGRQHPRLGSGVDSPNHHLSARRHFQGPRPALLYLRSSPLIVTCLAEKTLNSEQEASGPSEQGRHPDLKRLTRDLT